MSFLEELRESDVLARLMLQRVRNFGPRRIKRVAEHFGRVGEIFAQDSQALIRGWGLKTDQMDDLMNPDHFSEIRKEWDQARANGIEILTPELPSFPEALRLIEDPPSVLYVKGDLKENPKRLAMVGTRLPTIHGFRTAKRFARVLGENGVEVVSGMARGIDTASHEGALEAKARTVAVLGSGLLSIYPKENQKASVFRSRSRRGSRCSWAPRQCRLG